MSFTYQQWKKQESEQRIINALSDGDKSFGDLLESTDLSKPVLSERLKALKEKNKIEIVPETATKRFLYHLILDSLDSVEKSFALLHVVSKHIVTHLVESAQDSSLPDKEYGDHLVKGVIGLFNFRMLAHTIVPIAARKEWLKATLGVEFVAAMPKLFPKSRNLDPYLLNGMSPKEQTIYTSKDTKDAADQLLEYLKPLMKNLPLEW